MLKLLKIR